MSRAAPPEKSHRRQKKQPHPAGERPIGSESAEQTLGQTDDGDHDAAR